MEELGFQLRSLWLQHLQVFRDSLLPPHPAKKLGGFLRVMGNHGGILGQTQHHSHLSYTHMGNQSSSLTCSNTLSFSNHTAVCGQIFFTFLYKGNMQTEGRSEYKNPAAFCEARRAPLASVSSAPSAPRAAEAPAEASGSCSSLSPPAALTRFLCVPSCRPGPGRPGLCPLRRARSCSRVRHLR